MSHPRIWPHISDDYSGPPEDFRPILHKKGLYYLAPEVDGRRVGVFFYHAHSTVLWEVHTCVLPEFWGAAALYAARDGLRWMVDNTGCRKVITHVPDDNSVARRFAHRVGMVDEGVNRASFLKGGVLLDQYVLGITREEILCLQQR
jgi:RimJ/RimL family protein N-acetyltransferase